MEGQTVRVGLLRPDQAGERRVVLLPGSRRYGKTLPLRIFRLPLHREATRRTRESRGLDQRSHAILYGEDLRVVAEWLRDPPGTSLTVVNLKALVVNDGHGRLIDIEPQQFWHRTCARTTVATYPNDFERQGAPAGTRCGHCKKRVG